MKFLSFVFCLFIFNFSYAQDYSSFFTGNLTDVSTNPQFGVCLMGGASENDNAMQWFLNLANGGDVLVLRTSGSDGYNDYMFNQLSVSLNSVETIRIDLPSGAVDPYVLQKISQAEAIWFAGGDQADYVSFFKDNAVENLLNEHINIKQYPVGGISAGMAILGEFYFDALNGTVTTTEALNNPFNGQVSLGVSDFIDIPILEKTITDTHYDNPEREGRHMTFLARLQAASGERVFGIGLDEFTAVCIDSNGTARIFGEFPTFNDYAYFIQINCLDDTQPENLNPNQTLNWNLNQQAVKAYKVPGNTNGTNEFDLNTWENGIGGEWQNWWINQGVFLTSSSAPIDCDTFSNSEFENNLTNIYPNPVRDHLNISSRQMFYKVEIYNLVGQKIKTTNSEKRQVELNFQNFEKGIYLLKIFFENEKTQLLKVIRK